MYLVTGGSGFCGFEIVKFLHSRRHPVRIFDVESPPESLPGVEFIQGDIRDFPAIHRVSEGAEHVIHAAAKVPISKAGYEFWEVNVRGTRNVLEAALQQRVRKIVYLSSSSVQSRNPCPTPEEAPYTPVEAYSQSKVESETVCRTYIQKGLDIDILRPRTVLGNERRGLFSILFDWISEGLNVYILGDGQNKIQFLHVEDLAACCYLSATHPTPGIYNIGSREFFTLKEDLSALLAHAKTPSRLVMLPIAPVAAVLRVLDLLHLSPLGPFHYGTYHQSHYFSNENAHRQLKWEPRYGNQEILISAYDGFMARKSSEPAVYGSSHRKMLHQGVLKMINRVLSKR